jgi:hypothetical protein
MRPFSPPTALKSMQEQLAESAKQGASNDKQILVIHDQQQARDEQAAGKIATVTQPSNTNDQVVKDSTEYLQATPVSTPDSLFGFTKIDTHGLWPRPCL